MAQKLAEAGAVLHRIEQTLDDCEGRLMRATVLIERALHKLELLAKRLRSPATHLQVETARLQNVTPRLTRALHERWRMWKQRQAHGVAQLEAFSHKRVLARGYCLVKESDNGALVTSALRVAKHKVLDVVFHDGEVRVVPDAEGEHDV
jgi:exonuclease VII large subunit